MARRVGWSRLFSRCDMRAFGSFLNLSPYCVIISPLFPDMKIPNVDTEIQVSARRWNQSQKETINMKLSSKILLIAVATSSMAFAGSSIAGTKADIKKCMSAVVKGPQKNDLKIHGHGFNCKPWKISKSNGTWSVKGQISHQLRWRKDDQVNYSFKIGKNGKIVPPVISIGRGGIRATVPGPIKNALEEVVDGFTGGNASEIYSSLEKITKSDGWEKVASSLVARVSLEAAKKYRSANRVAAGPARSNKNCFAAVQNKVAWNKAGNKSWNPKNIRKLCNSSSKPTKVKINCFNLNISQHNDWRKALARCS